MEISRGSNSFDSGKSCQRGHWRPAEDDKLRQLVEEYGPKNWNFIAQHLEGRSGKSCRLRWYNQLDPNINKKPFTEEEEERLLKAHRIQGNRWASIARLFPGRTDNAVKNHFHVIMARRKRERFSCYATSSFKRSWQNIASTINHNSVSSNTSHSGCLARLVRPVELVNNSNLGLWRSQDDKKASSWPSWMNSGSTITYDSLLFDVSGARNCYNPYLVPSKSPLAAKNDQFGPSSVSNGGGCSYGSQEEKRRKELVGVCHDYLGNTFQKTESTDRVGRTEGPTGNEDEEEGKSNVPFIDFLGVGLVS